MNSGIYMILNKVTNMYYVGSAFNLKNRWKNHRIELNLNRHCNPYLQSAWNKYGEENFHFYVLEHVHKSAVIEREQRWLDHLKCYDRTIGYNICSVANSIAGRKASEETKALLSSIRKGKKIHTEESKAKIGIAQKGKIVSDETRKKQSESHKGEIRSDKFKKEMSDRLIGNQYSSGSKRSPEHIAAMAEGRRRAKIARQEKIWIDKSANW